jgi:cytochrome c oxidase cbb3-type subunit 2
MSATNLHHKLEENAGLLIFGILLVSAIGGLVQVLPSIFQESLKTPTVNARPYTALELEGRDLYLREGCSVCHSQQIRPLLAEVERYGPYSQAGEFVYDRPFLWGSKRTGPDLHRVGGKYSDAWQRMHLLDPRSVVPNSIMPAYPWLDRAPADKYGNIEKRMRALQKLGHPYTDEQIAAADSEIEGKMEVDALVAYLQVLGTFAGESAGTAHEHEEESAP